MIIAFALNWNLKGYFLSNLNFVYRPSKKPIPSGKKTILERLNRICRSFVFHLNMNKVKNYID